MEQLRAASSTLLAKLSMKKSTRWRLIDSFFINIFLSKLLRDSSPRLVSKNFSPEKRSRVTPTQEGKRETREQREEKGSTRKENNRKILAR